MGARKLALAIGVLGCTLSFSGSAAASISNSLGQFINRNVGLLVSGLVFPNIAGPFIERVALDSIQLPVPTSGTSFTFSYNPQLGVFERSSGSLGPVFLDRGETIGQGRFDLTFSYQFANLTDLNGDSFGKQLQFSFTHLLPDGTAVGGKFVGNDFSLKENVFSWNGTYGITDRWDVNLLVPMVYTSLDLNGAARGAAVQGGAQAVINQFPSFHDTAFGIGDILLRTKYRFYDNPDIVLLAGALTLRMPSGSAGNFQGLGDFTIAPALIVSRPIGRNDLHMNLAMDFNTMEGGGTRARYGIGATIQPFDKLAFLLDVLGSSGLDADKFSIPTGNVSPNCKVVTCINYSTSKSGNINVVVPRSDIVDLSTGIKFNPFASAIIYLEAIIPLTQQGLRAAVIPTGGFEWSF
jgi:hypothetical protein